MSNLSAFKGKKIAIVVASGFNEEQFLIIQKTILAAEGSYTIISRDIGTTNGWASEKLMQHLDLFLRHLMINLRLQQLKL